MKKVRLLLLMAVAVMANHSFAQKNVEIPVYSEVHHYYSKEVLEDRRTDSAFFYEKVMNNEFVMSEVKDIFAAKFKEVASVLDQMNKKSGTKIEGMIVKDEYGRKIYFPVEALRNDHVLLEGGEVINGVFFPNIISIRGISYQEDPQNPGVMLGVPIIIQFFEYK